MAEPVTESPEIRVEIPEPAKDVDGSRRERKRARQPIFHLDDVTVSYGDKPAVRNVTFDIARHEITALIGPSGCAPSALLAGSGISTRISGDSVTDSGTLDHLPLLLVTVS